MTTSEDPLVAAIEQLQQALAAAWLGRQEAWKVQLGEALRAVANALARQPAPTDKLIPSTVETARPVMAPGITREARSLRHDQEELYDTANRMAAELERVPGDLRDPAAVADTCADLVKKLQEFCASTNRLVFENVMRDTGVGD